MIVVGHALDFSSRWGDLSAPLTGRSLRLPGPRTLKGTMTTINAYWPRATETTGRAIQLVPRNRVPESPVPRPAV